MRFRYPITFIIKDVNKSSSLLVIVYSNWPLFCLKQLTLFFLKNILKTFIICLSYISFSIDNRREKLEYQEVMAGTLLSLKIVFWYDIIWLMLGYFPLTRCWNRLFFFSGWLMFNTTFKTIVRFRGSQVLLVEAVGVSWENLRSTVDKLTILVK